MATGEISKWSERGANPRLARIARAVAQYRPGKPVGAKVSHRQKSQHNTTARSARQGRP